MHHTQSLKSRATTRFGVVALGVLVAGTGLTFAAGSAAAAGCAASVTISGPSKGHLVLSPNSVKVQTGQCVAYSNSTSNKVTLSISQGGSTIYGPTSIGPGGSASFTPSSAGSDSVSASSKVVAQLITVNGSGSVTATAPPKPKPTKSSSPNQPPKQPSGSGNSGGSGKHPRVASNPKHSGGKHAAGTKKANGKTKGANGKPALPGATGIKLPPLPPLPSVGISALPKGSKPLVAPGVAPATEPSVAGQQPTSGSASPVAAVLSGPIEPLDSNRRGLPLAVGVLVVLGIATGWGRVLLATSGPGDNRAKASRHL